MVAWLGTALKAAKAAGAFVIKNPMQTAAAVEGIKKVSNTLITKKTNQSADKSALAERFISVVDKMKISNDDIRAYMVNTEARLDANQDEIGQLEELLDECQVDIVSLREELANTKKMVKILMWILCAVAVIGVAALIAAFLR